jgi:hypothetical protein
MKSTVIIYQISNKCYTFLKYKIYKKNRSSLLNLTRMVAEDISPCKLFELSDDKKERVIKNPQRTKNKQRQN